jgi:hypothetical protein
VFPAFFFNFDAASNQPDFKILSDRFRRTFRERPTQSRQYSPACLFDCWRCCLCDSRVAAALRDQACWCRPNGDNMMCIIIPCHRVIRADGSLCGTAPVCGGRNGFWIMKGTTRRSGMVTSDR